MKKINYLLIVVITVIFTAFNTPLPEEGMFPLSEIRNLNLKEAGLKIGIDEIYNPERNSLIDALVDLNGCTGSFVSNEGLIITNHHCSFGAVQRASTLENNYVENGFLARTRSEEIPASGITCRITISYKDVSAEILKAADETENFIKRTRAITAKINEIIAAENALDPSVDCRISEMFPGESYVLFRYKIINDVRLVYVPPRYIGEFGGESDNWVWPRHTGDFTFLRAYVAPDGSPASYSKENIPYQPKKFLKVNPEGVDENDFVFVLGYPARTFKNQPSYFIEHQQNNQLPFLQELYSWIINFYETAGEKNPQLALSLSSKVKSLSNAEKNYRGKIQGLSRLQLAEKKRNEESQLQNFINRDPVLKNKYGDVIPGIARAYKHIFDYGKLPFVTAQLSQRVDYYRLAEILLENEREQYKPDKERKQLYNDDNKGKLIGTVNSLYNNIYIDLDRQILNKILFEASRYRETQSFLNGIKTEDINSFTKRFYENTILSDKDKYMELLKKGSLDGLDDPFIDFVKKIEVAEYVYNTVMEVVQGELNILLARFMDAKREWLNKSFVPDANSTLRLTYGYVKGYSPADAVYYSPVTTLNGIIEKGQSDGDYKINKKIVQLYNNRDFGIFRDEKLNDVPVAILYNTDTSGGSSGSPVLDAYGNLVAINFDRAFEATINDYAWNENYSRSIGVDIRYVLWVTEKIGGAGFLLEELGIY